MADLKTNTNELQEVLSLVQSRVVDTSALETTDKTIVGAINEVNNKTFDKIAYLDTYYSNNSGIDFQEDGIEWINMFSLTDGDDMATATGHIYQKMPLVAGENVTFDIDSSNGSQFVKINATSTNASHDHNGEYLGWNRSSYDVDSLYDAQISMVAQGSNTPSGSPYGVNLTLPYRKFSGNTSPDFGAQIFFPNGDDSTKPNSMFYRTSLSGTWNVWKEVATIDEINNLNDNKLSTQGGTLKGNLTITNGSSTQAGEPSLKWKTVGANTPYIGFATDQSDGTFVFGSLKGTNYASGLAIGGGSGNLLWKGAKVITASELGPAATKGVATSVTSGDTNLVTSGAVYTAIANAITTALNTGV